MKITLNVEQQDGQTYQVTTNLFSIVALERKFKGESICNKRNYYRLNDFNYWK